MFLANIALITIPCERNAILHPWPEAQLLCIGDRSTRAISQVQPTERTNRATEELRLRTNTQITVLAHSGKAIDSACLASIKLHPPNVIGVPLDGLVGFILYLQRLVRTGVPSQIEAKSTIMISYIALREAMLAQAEQGNQ